MNYRWRILCTAGCLGAILGLNAWAQEIPKIELLPEPEYTRGDSNALLFVLPPRDSIPCDSISFAGIVLHIRSIVASIEEEHLTGIPPDSVRPNWGDTLTYPIPFKDLDIPFEDGATYEYYAKLRVDCENGPPQFSPPTDTVVSTQDISPPVVELPDELQLPSCMRESSFEIRFQARDAVSGCVGSATLYHRTDSTAAWMPVVPTQKILDCRTTNSIVFTASQDGYHEFFVGARDTAWAPDNSGRAGNELKPDSLSKPHTFTFVDTREPTSEIVGLAQEQNSLQFDVCYRADDNLKDGYERGLGQVALWYKFENETFKLFEEHDLSGNKSAVDSCFQFSAMKGDGQYSFFTITIDACGNADTSDTVLTEVIATPKILHIFPPAESFQHASDVDSIVIVFDRPVAPQTSWSDVITLINRYALDEAVRCRACSDTSAVDTLIWFPERIDSTGFYEVILDICQLENVDCGVNPAVTHVFNFYTFMEAGKGGQIRTPDVVLTVDGPGQPGENVAFVFDSILVDCETEGFESFSDFGVTVAAKRNSLDGPEVGEIPGELCISFPRNIGSSTPGTCRIFEKDNEHCILPRGTRLWDVDFAERKVCARMADVTGTFKMLCQAAVSRTTVGNYPNPFGSSGERETTITYTLRAATTTVNIRIYDLFGNLVRTFRDTPNNQGLNICPWDGKNDRGEEVASGGYICVVDADGQKFKRKIAVMR